MTRATTSFIKASFLLGGSLFFVLLLVGCGRRAPADLVIVNGVEPESLDPAVVTGQGDGRVVRAMFEGLTRLDPVTAKPVPGIAERWDVSADGMSYTFHLRTNALWSTGERIVSEDFLFSWRRLLDPATAASYASMLFCVEGAERFHTTRSGDVSSVAISAPDPRTFEVRLNAPTPYFLDLCAFWSLAVVPREWIGEHGDAWILAVGKNGAHGPPVSGAYQLESWRLNDRIRLRRNDRYWDAANTRTETIDLLPLNSATTALNLYLAGEVDVIWDKDLVPVELIPDLLPRPDFHSFNYLGTYFIRLNVTAEPLSDPRVRRALALAVDKRRIVERITRAGENVAEHFTPDGVAGYDPPAGLAFDPGRARAELSAAGYPGGAGFPEIEYSFNASAGGAARMHERIAVELQEMWREHLGISVGLHQTEWKVFLAAQKNLEYGLSRSSWIGDYNDPNTFLEMFVTDGGNNRTGWSSVEYDRLIAAANATADAAERAGLFRRAESILVEEELPIIPLYFYVGLNCHDPERIRGIYDNVLDLHPLRAIEVVAP